MRQIKTPYQPIKIVGTKANHLPVKLPTMFEKVHDSKKQDWKAEHSGNEL